MSMYFTQKPHAVCVPFPSEGHVNPFMQLAKLLHWKGFHITFVNTEFNHRRLIRSHGAESVKGQHDFQFETIPDGLPPSDVDATQDVPTLCDSTQKNCLAPFKELLKRLISSAEVPLVSCIIADGATCFAIKAAKELGIPNVQFWTTSACGFQAYLQFDELVERGIIPFKDESFFGDGTLDTTINWIPGMKNMRLRDIPSHIRITNLNQIMFNFMGSEARYCWGSSSIILNTFQELESEVLDVMTAKNPNLYVIGPLHLLGRHSAENESELSGLLSLWKNDTECLQWLDQWEPNSVIYVNYGSITVMSEEHLKEFAWGLANSKHPFLWIVRPDVVKGEEHVNLPQEFLDEVKDRGYITSWCPQTKVLAHPSIGVFLSHCGWNSTIESIAAGVPSICWPFFADQQTNCRYACTSWGIGMEVNDDVKREEIEALVNEAIMGEKGKEMRQRGLEWKEKAMRATDIGGPSYNDFNRLLQECLHYDV